MICKRLLFLTWLLVSLSLPAFGQGYYRALIVFKYSGNVYLFDQPGGKVIDNIKNDTVAEDFIVLTISQEKKEYFYVNAVLAESGKNKEGWIRKARYIGATAKCSLPITLYSKRSLAGKKRTIKVTDGNHPEPFWTIKTFYDDWAYISAEFQNKTLKGWIPVKDLCYQPYSGCCGN